MERLSIEAYKLAEKLPVVVVLDNVRSLNNIGSVFRSCDALRIAKIYLCGITAIPPHRDIRKTALGAEDSVSWEYMEDAAIVVDRFKEQDYRILAVEQTQKSTMLHRLEVGKTDKMVLIFGNEVKGVQQAVVDKCDGCIEIPQEGTKHSLNISVSVGMVLWEVYRQLKG